MKDLLVKIDIDPRFANYVYQELDSRRNTIATKNDKVERDLSESFDPRSITSE